MTSRRCVAFQTPGLIPLESFTTFGVNSKPMRTSPFGYFGTGLKYAIAVLLREGCEVVLWRGMDKYTFFVKQEDFRDKNFGFVRMKKETYSLVDQLFMRPRYFRLPFTTELGKNWKLWQAFRELETNTRDEGGVTQLKENFERGLLEDETIFLVYGERFVDEFVDMNRHFLPGGKIVREDEAIQIIDKPSKQIYYRSVRIVDLKEESEFTYNILSHVELTEDRTAKYAYQIEALIAGYISQSEDEDFVGRAITSHKWEGRGLSYSYAYATPSPLFLGLAPQARNETVKEFLKTNDPTVSTSTVIHLTIPKPEVTEDELHKICDAVYAATGFKTFTAKNILTEDVVDYNEGEEDEHLPPEALPPEEPKQALLVDDDGDDIPF